MSVPQADPGKEWVRLGRPATRSVMVFGGPPADSPETPHTEMVVQVTLSAQAHPDDVATVLDKLRAAIKEATDATAGRIDVQFALPEIVR